MYLWPPISCIKWTKPTYTCTCLPCPRPGVLTATRSSRQYAMLPEALSQPLLICLIANGAGGNFPPKSFYFFKPVRSPTFQELGALASVLSPSLGGCLARTEPCDVAVDGFRRLGVFLVPALEKAPCAPPSFPAGEPAQMVPGGDLGSFPKPEMGAGAYLGGGGRMPVLGLEARCYHRNQSTGGLSSAR